MAIILLAFVPSSRWPGGRKAVPPLAFPKTFAVLTATVLALTLVPVLCTLLLKGRLHDESANPVMRALRAIYKPSLEWALSHRAIPVAGAVLLLLGAVLVGSRIGSEFMPPLNEGDLLFMPVTDPSVSLEENTEIARRQNAALMRVPEVEYAVAKVGRADTSTDPSPQNMTETIVHLKPRESMAGRQTLDTLRPSWHAKRSCRGQPHIWTLPASSIASTC